MALTGQLSDMSLAELIEFFCNQRKTGRLKVDYHRGHGVFFIKDGELVDAKVGALMGAEAVYFALTLPNAAFDFSSDIEPPRRTIKQTWTQVVLEGLRRLDEGESPKESDAFGSNGTPTEADMAVLMDHVERLGAANAAQSAKASKESEETAAAPLSMMVEGVGEVSSGRRKMMFVVAACLVLACAVAAIPLAGRFGARPAKASQATSNAPVAATETETAVASEVNATASEAASANEAGAPAEAAQAAAEAATVDTAAAAALAARREREARERAAREREARERKQEEAKKQTEEPAAKPAGAASTSSATAPAPAGPRSVRVSVAYDEQGRVTQASVAGASSGAEAYGGTAVRIARGRRFPAGKAGATVITIPVN